MDYDNSDLLGSGEFPVVREQPSWQLPSGLTLFAILGITAILLVLMRDGQQKIREWQERRYRLQKRRRHGIPDNDRSPFNVAYAAAVRVRKEREALERVQRQNEQKTAREHVDASPNWLPQTDVLRQRVTDGTASRRLFGTHGTFPVSTANVDTDVGNTHFSPQHVAASTLNRPGAQVHFAVAQNGGDSSEMARKSNWQPNQERQPPISEGKKHPLDEEDAAESSKKFRVEGEELIDGDNEVSWDEVPKASNRRNSGPKPQRGSKRQASPDDDNSLDSTRKKGRDKRARRISREKRASAAAEQRVVDDEGHDEAMGLDPISRGKKRDRAEAGSTFGGDEDSPEKKSRRRKRRSGGQDGTDTLSRGKKRQHDAERTPDSDAEEPVLKDKVARKRGKQMVIEAGGVSDESMDSSKISNDPSCKGREIGEEWDANGQRWKVSPGGKRMRQALIRKRRTRYSMPKDSEHPDSQAQLQVVVETWLTDEEFKTAEERGDLYIPTKEPDVASTLVGDAEDSPSKAGKTLLWSTPRKTNVAPRKAFKDSIVTNVGIHMNNPFDKPHSGYGRRVASGHLGFKVPDSPGLRQSKSYSKWEKQDLEADSMAKLRKRLEDQKKVASPDKRVTFQLASSTSAPSIPSSFSVPSATGPDPTPLQSAQSTSEKPTLDTVSVNASGPTCAFPTSGSSTVKDVQQPKLANSFSFASTNPAHNKGPESTRDNSAPSASPWSTAPTSEPASRPPSTFSAGPFGSMPGASSFAPSFSSNQGKGSDAASGPKPANFFTQPTSNTPTPVAPTNSGASPNSFSIKGVSQSGTTESSASTSTLKPGPLTAETPAGNLPTSTSVFGATSGDGVKVKQSNTPGQSQNIGGPSLVSRLGGLAPSAPNPGATGGSLFSFGATKLPAPPVINSNPASSPFGGPASTTPSSASSATAAPKFNFGFAPKSTTPTPTSSAGDPSKGAAAVPSPFKFNPPSVPSQPTSASKSSFGMGPPPSSQSSTVTPTVPTSTSVFGSEGSVTGSSTTAGTVPVGAPPTPRPSFSFGNSSSGSNPFMSSKPTGNTSGVFGGPSKASEAPKPLFGFGGGSASSNGNATTPTTNIFGNGSSSTAGATAPVNVFGGGSTVGATPNNTFGSGFSSNSAADNGEKKPAFSFNFGASSGNTK